MKAVFRKELRSLLGSLTGWGSIAVLLAAAGVSAFFHNIQGMSPLFADNILYVALGMALACGLMGMNAFPGERRARTERALYALPLGSGGVFLGKLLARLVVMLLGCALLALYPLGLSLAASSAAPGESLGCVLAVCAMGVLFTAAALCCSAFSRTAIEALLVYAALVALAYFLPSLAPRVEALTALSPLTLVLLSALAGVLAWAIFNDVLAGFIAAAIVEAPVLLCHLRGNDSAVFRAMGGAMRAVSVFEPMALFSNGILDLAAIVRWLSFALPFVAAGIVAVAARRQAKRRAL